MSSVVLVKLLTRLWKCSLVTDLAVLEDKKAQKPFSYSGGF